MQLRGRSVLQQLQHVLRLDRAEAADEHGDVHCSTGSIFQLTRENRAQQAVVAGCIAALGGDVADLPADHVVIPAGDGQILHLVGSHQVRRDKAREAGQGLAGAARGGEGVGDRGRIVRRRRLPMYAVFVAQERSPSGVVALPIDSVCRRCIW
ncbi:hypothetical protein D3C72_1088460 [compost metagenome]